MLKSWVKFQSPEEPYCHTCLTTGFLSACNGFIEGVGDVPVFLCSVCADTPKAEMVDLPDDAAPPDWRDPHINMNALGSIPREILSPALKGCPPDALACALHKAPPELRWAILATLPDDRNGLVQSYLDDSDGLPLRIGKAGQAFVKAALLRQVLGLPHPPV